MTLTEYSGRGAYHFESSENFCAPLKIRRALRLAMAASRWSAPERAHLSHLAALELLRARLGVGKITLETYRQRLARRVGHADAAIGHYVFHHCAAHDAFYASLNDQYEGS